VAIEVSLWVLPIDVDDTSAASRYNAMGSVNSAHEYRQTVYLPMSQVSSSGGMGMGGAGGMSKSGSGSSSGMGGSSSSSSSGGSNFGGSNSGGSQSGF
jgi:hypothetical protein